MNHPIKVRREDGNLWRSTAICELLRVTTEAKVKGGKKVFVCQGHVQHEGRIWTQIPNSYEAEGLEAIRLHAAMYYHRLLQHHGVDNPKDSKEAFERWDAVR